MTDRLTAAEAMRALDPDARNEAIDNSPNVLDLRPELEQRAHNRALGEGYRRAFSFRPRGGKA